MVVKILFYLLIGCILEHSLGLEGVLLLVILLQLLSGVEYLLPHLSDFAFILQSSSQRILA